MPFYFDVFDFINSPNIDEFILIANRFVALLFGVDLLIDAIHSVCLAAGYEIEAEKIKSELERFGINYDEVEKEGGKSI